MDKLVMLSEREVKSIETALGGLDRASAKLADALKASATAHEAVNDPARFAQWKAALYAAFKDRDAGTRARLRQAVRRLSQELFPPAESRPRASRMVPLGRAYDALLAALAAAPPSAEKSRASQALDVVAAFLRLKE